MISRIHVQPITSDAVFVTDYAGKAIKKKLFSNDGILVLPRTVNELPSQKQHVVDSRERAIKDLQAQLNVSDEVAEQMLAKQHAL
jgi:hypothetical protein